MHRATSGSKHVCGKAAGKGNQETGVFCPLAWFTHRLPESWALESIGKAIHTKPEGPLGTAPLL